MEHSNVILFSVPLFIAAILVEMFRGRKKPLYSVHDTLANLTCGMGSQIFGIIAIAVTALIYSEIVPFAPILLPANHWLTWIFAFIVFDFFYYWFHRISHERNIFWIFHVVHHQSERYNLSVALRQSWFGGLVSWIFYLPMALLGVPLSVFLTVQALNLAYQFFIHTQLVERLGFLEWILNTPSHHRVHHGSIRPYIDKNYGGAFIIWDRLFGTFVAEKIPVRYGIIKPLSSWSGFTANVQPVIELCRAVRQSSLELLIRNPGWQKGDRNVDDAIDRGLAEKFPELKQPSLSQQQVLRQIIYLSLCITATVLIMGNVLPYPYEWTLAAFLIAGFYIWGEQLDRSN